MQNIGGTNNLRWVAGVNKIFKKRNDLEESQDKFQFECFDENESVYHETNVFPNL